MSDAVEVTNRWRPTLTVVRAGLAIGVSVSAQAIAPPPPGFPPGVDGSTHVSYYEVRGRTVAELAADMRRQGPKGDDGQLRTAFTDSRLRWRFVTQPDGAICRATGARVTISAEVLMPKWVPPADTESGVFAMWSQSMSALAVHEAGHREILIRFAKAIRDRIMSMRTRCDRFISDANTASNILVAEMRAAQSKYDVDTQNGLTQGTAFLPRRIPEPLADVHRQRAR